MTKEEKREYIENIFEMVLSGEENFELAESLISSLNLRDDFKNYANKERDRRRVKNSFLQDKRKSFFLKCIKNGEDFSLLEKTKEDEEMDFKMSKLSYECQVINNFLVSLYFKWKREELAEYTKEKPQQNEGAKLNF